VPYDSQTDRDRQSDRHTNILKKKKKKTQYENCREGGRMKIRTPGHWDIRAGSAPIFMAWRRSNLIKVPARQHLECECAALARVRVQGA